MRKYPKVVLFFLLGFAFMATLQLLSRCSKDDDWLEESISPEETVDNIDYKAIESAVSELKDAFKTGDQNALDDLTLDEKQESFAMANTPYTSEELQKIGDAMAKAKRVVVTSNYVEYTYTIDGETFSFSLANDDEGTWKLLNY